ncbi:AAA family ATPase [Halobacteriovorax sp. HLS]|uniref:AAA family ATPase n=1 Tax=Halobacteriovorax sp. HLS TaxID=2234000 RepID=UPI000FDC4CE3|nr:AAA family ATPase [Halobacteriovorax sp. HLS]
MIINKKTLLILISGLSCTGKTSIAKQLSVHFKLPLFGRDCIKESLFDSLGCRDREWSKKLGTASYELLYKIIESQLGATNSCIVESNFNSKFDTPIFLNLQKKYKFSTIIIHCEAEGETLFNRFKARSESGQRHQGHCDHLNYDEFRDVLLNGRLDILDIDAEVIKLDTTDFSELNLDEVYEKINKEITK